MNNIDYNQSGGFPLSTQILAAAQEAYRGFNAFGNLAGSLAIISGCETINVNEVGDGFVSIYGELLPFKSATKSANVVIVENTDLRGFEDGSAKAVIYTRYVTFGSSVVEYPWANFRRPLTLFQLEDRLIKVEKSFPIGTVVFWGKFAEDIPEGFLPWDIAEGCVLVGRKVGDVNFGAALGTKIGVAQVTLDITQIPEHNHTVSFGRENVGSGNQNSASCQGGNSFTATSSSKGGGQSHTNIQPSLIVDHMIFVGFN